MSSKSTSSTSTLEDRVTAAASEAITRLMCSQYPDLPVLYWHLLRDGEIAARAPWETAQPWVDRLGLAQSEGAAPGTAVCGGTVGDQVIYITTVTDEGLFRRWLNRFA